MFDIHAGDLTSLTKSLDRIGDLLERLVNSLAPPPLPDSPVAMADVSDLHTIDDSTSEQVSAGKRAIALSFGVVPDSEAFDLALDQYEREMKKIYGADYKTDWEDIFRRAAQAAGTSGAGN